MAQNGQEIKNVGIDQLIIHTLLIIIPQKYFTPIIPLVTLFQIL